MKVSKVNDVDKLRNKRIVTHYWISWERQSFIPPHKDPLWQFIHSLIGNAHLPCIWC